MTSIYVYYCAASGRKEVWHVHDGTQEVVQEVRSHAVAPQVKSHDLTCHTNILGFVQSDLYEQSKDLPTHKRHADQGPVFAILPLLDSDVPKVLTALCATSEQDKDTNINRCMNERRLASRRKQPCRQRHFNAAVLFLRN